MAHNDNLDIIREACTKLGMTMELASGWQICFPKNPKSRGAYAVMWKAYPLSQGRETQMTVTIDFDEAEQVSKATMAFPVGDRTYRGEATYKASTFTEAVRGSFPAVSRFHLDNFN